MKSRQFQIASTLALVMASSAAFTAVSWPLAAQCVRYPCAPPVETNGEVY
jgi:hypothetical protein